MKKRVYSDYARTDRLGSVVNLTDQYGRVPAQIDYDDWGKVTAYQSLNISGGYRTVLPEITYAGHQYDDVLGMYYAKARMYDAENRRFASVDPVKGRITGPMSIVQYLYVVDDLLRWVGITGKTVYGSLGLSGSAYFGWGASGGTMVIWDDKGNEASIITGLIPFESAGTPNASINFNLWMYSDADNIFEFVTGFSGVAGGSFGPIGVKFFLGVDTEGDGFSGYTVIPAIASCPWNCTLGFHMLGGLKYINAMEWIFRSPQ